jgi:SAM-dependent methyltransferase
VGESKKFDPAKRKKLNSPERLQWVPPNLVQELVGTGATGQFLDIGAGTGYMTAKVGSLMEADSCIYALDIEPLMVREMEDTLPADGRVQPLLMERDRLPFDDGSIDGAWTVTLFHELEPAGPLLAEIRRVLRPKGRLLIIDWDLDEAACNQGPPREHRVPAEDVALQLEKAGFHEVTITSGFIHHYGVLAVA